MQQENQKHNLTRLASDDLIYEQYFLESLLPYIKTGLFTVNSNYHLLDIGSGSGIPGVVLKLVYPELQVVLLDSNKKKTDFLNSLVEYLGLTDGSIQVIYDRAEVYVQKHYETFDIVTSRAVSSLYKILELSAGYAKVNGYIIQPKSLKAQEELTEAQGTIKTLNLDLLTTIKYSYINYEHNVFVFKKLKPTDKKFPRS